LGIYFLSTGKLLRKFQKIASPFWGGLVFGLMHPEDEGCTIPILHNAAKHSIPSSSTPQKA
jgi:hypothetical protein